MPAVRCVDVCKTYRQGDLAVKGLDHVSLEIEDGGFVCLSAPSGGGKTTLLNAIGGLHRIDSGEIWIADQRIHELGEDVSKLSPFWYAGAFAIGAASGLLGDKWSLGFVAETERQAADLARGEAEEARERAKRIRGRLIVMEDESAG